MGETVQYPTPNGGNVSGYLATATGSTKHVVVIQEWWGSILRSAGCAIALRQQGLTP